MRYWSRPLIVAVLFAVGLLALAGCTQREAPSSMAPGTPQFSEAVSPYTLAFISRNYDSESNTTTFTYQLQNTTSPGSPATGVLAVFTEVFVQVPACAGAPVSMSPPDGASLGAVAAGYGVTWGVGYDDNPSLNYAVTFSGDVPSGTVHAQVSNGGSYYVQSVTGPCEGSFEVSGYVFTDADQDGAKTASELGVSNVTVKLTDGETAQTAKTDSDGHYLFLATTGTYTVSVDSATVDNTDYNETLYDQWEQTNSQSVSVTVGPNSIGNNFGWEPDVDKILALVAAGDITTNGKSYKWWRREFYRVLNGNDQTAYTETQLLDFVHTIEGYALLDEFDFTPGHELQEVYDILNNHFLGDDANGNSVSLDSKYDQGKHDAVKFFVRELLTFELNHVSGRGFDDVQMRTIIINWAEGVLKVNSPAPGYSIGGPQAAGTREPQRALSNPLESGSTLLKSGNTATGGGGTGN